MCDRLISDDLSFDEMVGMIRFFEDEEKENSMCEVKTVTAVRNFDIVKKTLQEENPRYLHYKKLQSTFGEGHQTIRNTARKAFTDGDPMAPEFTGAVKTYEDRRAMMMSLLTDEEQKKIVDAGL
jgi:hypothetical protein